MSQTNHIPDEKIWCHRTGFAKKCQDMVIKKRCPLWVGLRGTDKDTGAPIDVWGCADTFGPQIATQSCAQLTMQLEMVAKGIDHLRREVQGENIKPMLQGIQNLNDRMNEARENGIGFDPVKLLGKN